MIKWYTLKEAAAHACRLNKPINQHQLLREVTYGDLSAKGPHEIALKHTPRGKGTPIWHISEECLMEYLEEDYKQRVETKKILKEKVAAPKPCLTPEAKDAGEVRRAIEQKIEDMRLKRLLENLYE